MSNPEPTEIQAVEGSLPHWIETALLGVLQPGGAWIARACGPERIIELVCSELRVEQTVESFASVVGVLRVIIRTPDEAVWDIREREVRLGTLDDGRGSKRLDDDALARAESAAACWRGAAEHRLARVVAEFETHDVYDCMPGLGLVATILVWIDEGPPGPRPCPLHLDDEVFARAARSLRELDEAEMEPLRARLGHHAGLGYRIGHWTIVLGPYLVRPDHHVFWEDQILVMVDGETPCVILMSDPWDKPTCSVVDGDPHAYRGFATWLGEALRRSGQDRVLRSLRDDDDDFDDDDETPAYDEFPVSAWLRFGDRWREEVECDALVDWRVQRDIVIPGALFWCSGIYGHTAERRAELARGVDTWHRFLREVIDPSFVGRRPVAE